MKAGPSGCYDKALSLLARAEHSRRLLEAKLVKKGYEAKAVEDALDRLESQNLLNDLRYAETWASFRMRKRGEGATLLIAGLVKRGIDRDTAAEAVRRCRNDASYGDAIRKAYDKLMRKGPLPEASIVAALQRKGFSKNEIKGLFTDNS